MDLLDAGIRSGGNFLAFFMRLNLVAWYRLVSLALREVLHHIGISCLDDAISALQRVKIAMCKYLEELEEIDIERYKKETEVFLSLETDLANVSEDDLNEVIMKTFESLGINRPWEGDFNEFMLDRSKKLVFG